MPNYPVFTDDGGGLNDNGRKLANFLSVNLQQMQEASADELNQFPGPLKYLFHNQKLSGMTVEQFIRDNGKSAALNAWRIMEAVEAQEAQAEKVEETAQQTSELVKQLEALAETVKAQAEEIKALKEAATKPEPKGKKPAKVEEVEDESEAE